MYRVLDLFSGIGGFSLGLERTGGFQTVAFCEIDPFCRKVLKKHWPEVPCYDDVRELTAERLAADGIGVDVICGGFPCQDISVAGKGAGLAGERSGLWSEIARLASELRPRFVIVENVSALLHRGLDTVLGDLAEIGFDAEWHCIPAAAVGAPHIRDRLWLVGHADDRSKPAFAIHDEASRLPGVAAHTDSISIRDEQIRELRRGGQAVVGRVGQDVADADCKSVFGPAITWPERHPWVVEPDVGRVAHGVPSRVDRLRALGNAVVPQIPELIGRAILATESEGA